MIKQLRLILALLIVVTLIPINVFAEDSFLNDIVNGQVDIKEESNIFEFTVDVTRKAIDIMENTKNEDKAVVLLDKLLSEYEKNDRINPNKLLKRYLYYKENIKNDIEYELFYQISDAIICEVADKIEAVIKQKTSKSQMIKSINKILGKYNLNNDLYADKIINIYNESIVYGDENRVYDEIWVKIFKKYERLEIIHYRTKKLINEIDNLKSEDEIINQIDNFVKKDIFIFKYSIKSEDILDTYKNYKKYGYKTKEEAVYEKVIDTIKSNNIRRNISCIYEEIIEEIEEIKDESKQEDLHDLLVKYGIESIVDDYDLIKTHRNYKEYGYDEEAIVKEGLKALDISYSEKTINDIIDKLIKVVDNEKYNSISFSGIDEKLKKEIYDEIYEGLYDIFIDYKIKEKLNEERIVEAYINYKKEGYENYEDAIMISINEMFLNSSLQEKIISIINDIGDVNEIEKIREEISDYLKESNFEKYIDYNAINEIINNDNNHGRTVKAISDTMIDAIINSNEEEIWDVLEEVIEYIDYCIQETIEKEKSEEIVNILKDYNLEEYINTSYIFKICRVYKNLEYNSREQALYEEIFKAFTKKYSGEEKNNIKNEIIKVLNEKDDIFSNTFPEEEILYILEDNDLEECILAKDILNIYNDCGVYGYESVEEGIINEIIKGTVKKLRQDIIQVINSGAKAENIKKAINIILKNNDLDYKIDAVKIIDFYNNYKKYRYKSSAEALDKELEKLFFKK